MKIRLCVEEGCKNAQTTEDYCRLHYVKNWKKIREEGRKKAASRLNRYVDGICKKFPERYMDVIRREIRNGKGSEAKSSEDGVSNDMMDDLFEDLGHPDEDNLDRLLSRIKLDKDY